MLKGFIAATVAACILALPAGPAMARTQDRAPDLMELIEAQEGDMVANIVRDQLQEAGLEVGVVDARATEALRNEFGADVLDNHLPLPLHTDSDVGAVVLVPLELADLEAKVLPVLLFGADWSTGLEADISGETLLLRDRGGESILSIAQSSDPLAFDGLQTEIMAIDLPVDISLDPVIDALQQVLDLLYTIKGLINSVICAVQASIDLLYGMDNCGFGATVIGGGAIYQVATCSAVEIQSFITTVQNYCF